MKKIIFLVLFASSAFASDSEKFCTAYEKASVSYGSTLWYEIDCGEGVFQTPRIMTSYLLPLPYNWKAASVKRLKAAMAARGVVPLSKIPNKIYAGNFFEKNLLVYGPKSAESSGFCEISVTNTRTIGLSVKTVVSDLHFTCDLKTAAPEGYLGLTQAEIAEVIRHLGFVKTNLPSLYRKP